MLCRLSLTTLALAVAGTASALDVRVTITNNAPQGGVAITPVWVGFHDGSFDSYNGGLTSQLGLEQLAEDGTVGQISADFLAGNTYVQGGASGVFATAQTSGRVDGAIGAASGPPPLQPGETNSQVFTIDIDGSNRFFSYASMVLPTNDFFVANGNPLAHDLMSLYDGEGTITFNIGNANGGVNDAGTEAEDYRTSAANGLFGLAGGQSGPDTPAGSLGLPISNVNGALPLDALNFIEGSQPLFDFNNTALYTNGIATITITAVPEPSSVLVGLLAMIGAGATTLRRRLG